MHNCCEHRHIQRFQIECFIKHFGRLSTAILQKSRLTDVRMTLIVHTRTSVNTPSIKLCNTSNSDYRSNRLSADTSAPSIKILMSCRTNTAQLQYTKRKERSTQKKRYLYNLSVKNRLDRNTSRLSMRFLCTHTVKLIVIHERT